MDFVLFWKSPSPFCQQTLIPFKVDGVRYNCAEQYMMSEKAKLFNDQESWDKIMQTNNPSYQRTLGREVRNFNPYIWEQNCYAIVAKGNYNKFSQNTEFKNKLLKTENKIIVEASPYDRIWGVGLAANDRRILNPTLWEGQNRLGKVLMNVRNLLKSDDSTLSQGGKLFISKSCPICLEEFDLNNDSLTSLSCGHVYHSNCKQQLTICAICRMDI